MMNNSSLLFRGAIWIALTRIMVNLIGLISTVILARLLLPDDFGLVAIASAAAAILAGLSELSLTLALIQHDDPTDQHFDTAWSLNLLRGVVLALVISLLGWPMAHAYGDERLIEVMLGFGVATLIGGLLNPKLVIYERRLEFHQWIVLSGGEKLAGFLTAALIAYVFESYWALVASVVASQSVKVIVSYLLVRYRPGFSLAAYRELISFSVWLTFGQIVQSLSWRSDALIFGAVVSNTELGYYNVGNRIANLAVNEALQPPSQVLFPAFAKLKGDSERLRSAYLRAEGILCMMALPLAFGIAAIAEPLVRLLLGPNWEPAVILIQLVAIAVGVIRLSELQALAMALGNTRLLFKRDVAGLVIRIPLVLSGLFIAPFIEVNALVGAMTGHLLASVLNTLLNFWLISRISGISCVEQFSLVVRPGAASLVMGAAVLTVSMAFPAETSVFSQVMYLIMYSMVGVAVYTISVFGLWLIAGRPDGAEAEAVDVASVMVQKVGFNRST